MPRYYKRRSFAKKKTHWDKKAFIQRGNTTAGTQSNTSLFTAPVAGVVSGLIVDVDLQSNTSATISEVAWAILVVKEGYTPNNINGGSGDFYIPEQDLWAWGTGLTSLQSATGLTLYNISASPKTKRKMEEGDQVYLCLLTGFSCLLS